MSPEGHDRDRLAIRRLVDQYAVAARDGDLYAAAFSDDGVLVTPKGEVRGREALAAVPSRLGRHLVTVHVVASHHVTFGSEEPDRAEGVTFCVAHHRHEAEEGSRTYQMMIRYDDEYRRVDGTWRIARRQLTVLWDEDHPAPS